MMYKVAAFEGEPILYEETDFIDDSGTKRTRHEFVKIRPDRSRIRVPVIPPIEITNLKKNSVYAGGDQTRRLKPHQVRDLYHQHRDIVERA